MFDPVITVAATGRALELSDAKRHLRLLHTQDDDTHIEDLILAAQEFIRLRTECTLIATEYQLTLDAWPCEETELTLPYPPVTAVEITYFDEAGDSQIFTDYTIRRSGNIESVLVLNPDASWPAVEVRSDAIAIVYTAGLGANADQMPANVRHAMRLLVGHWYEQRDPVITGTISKSLEYSLESLLNQLRTGRYSGIAG